MDSDGEVGPFYDAVEGEEQVDSDDDCNWDDEAPHDTGNQPSDAAECENPPNEPELIMTEQELMKLSNAAL